MKESLEKFYNTLLRLRDLCSVVEDVPAELDIPFIPGSFGTFCLDYEFWYNPISLNGPTVGITAENYIDKDFTESVSFGIPEELIGAGDEELGSYVDKVVDNARESINKLSGLFEREENK